MFKGLRKKEEEKSKKSYLIKIKKEKIHSKFLLNQDFASISSN